LSIGDPAPKLTVKEFVLGEPVTHFEKGKVYVVEFWKNGCPPCREIVPYLTELQKKYPQVIFIGVGVITPTNMLREYAKKTGAKMGYRVAIDAVPEGKSNENDGAMLLNWLIASGYEGVPHAFIIDGNGKIAWMGHPAVLVGGPTATLGKVRSRLLEKICAGKWDLQAAAAEFKKNYRRFGIVDPEEVQRWLMEPLPWQESSAYAL
jgi:thiol-disulfide isomerase/thioredoxin